MKKDGAIFSLLVLALFSSFSTEVTAHTATEDHESELVELVLLLDDSQSLKENNFRLQQDGFKEALRSMVAQGMGDYISTISVIYFGSSSTIALQKGENLEEILLALSANYSSGSRTNMTAALMDASSIFAANIETNGHNVHKLLILSTDGKPVSKTTALSEAEKLKLNGVHVAAIGVGGSSSIDVPFLNSIVSHGDLVPTPVDFSDFGESVSKLVLSQFATVIGRPVVTQFTQSITDNSVTFSCEGEAVGYGNPRYQLEYFGKGGESVLRKTVSGAGPIIDSYSFSDGEGIYHASCILVAASSGTVVRSLPSTKHFAIASDTTDSDGDGLPDTWEEEGLKDANGNVFLDLPALGANSLCKDVFVEVDWLVSGKHSARPNRQVFEQVIKAFSEAPVTNEGGSRCKGINLHIDAGADLNLQFDVAQNRIVSIASSLAGGNPIPDNDEIIADEIHYVDVSKRGDSKYLRSNLEWNRQHAKNFDKSRNGVYRYALIAPNRVFKKISGMAHGGMPGAGFWAIGEPFSNWSSNESETASTFMHELGHNLGLGHGGASVQGVPDNDNHKPNYLSIMNYNYQLKWLGKKGLVWWDSRRMDYSRWRTVDLHENSLDESTGISIVAPAGDSIAISQLNNGLSLQYSCRDSGKETVYSDAKQSTAIDWNCDGDVGDRSVRADINADPSEDDWKPYYSPLNGSQQSDWEALSYRGHSGAGVGVITAFEALKSQGTVVPEESYIEPSALAYSVSLYGERTADIVAGQEYTLDLVLENIGELNDTYRLSTSNVSSGLSVSLNVETLTLNSSRNAAIQLKLVVPFNTNVGKGFSVSIAAVSQSNATISDSIDVSLKVGERSDIDPNMLACINRELGAPIGSVPSTSQLNSITVLECHHFPDDKISSIAALYDLPNLQYLNISGSSITDITVLAELDSLIYLDISDNQIDDLTPLSQLENLTELLIFGNCITDLLNLGLNVDVRGGGSQRSTAECRSHSSGAGDELGAMLPVLFELMFDE